jgi:hypothetical protein
MRFDGGAEDEAQTQGHKCGVRPRPGCRRCQLRRVLQLRPLLYPTSDHPAKLEYGLIQLDGRLRVEQFSNR